MKNKLHAALMAFKSNKQTMTQKKPYLSGKGSGRKVPAAKSMRLPKHTPVKKPAVAKPARIAHRFTLAEMTIAFVVIGLITGIVIYSTALIETSRLHSQVSQIDNFDSAAAIFYDKYEGLPGDLLAVSAERFGLPYGDGTPGHGDNDGKISPCNLGLQWNLGCETALFWAQLYATGLVSDNFSADSKLTDDRLVKVGMMEPFLPQSPIAEGIYVAVWNTDATELSPEPQLPYGNYYEISRITGARQERLLDDANALTPMEARAVDEKIDDGAPLTGRVLVNGLADWPVDAWGTFAHPGDRNCVTPDHTYNIYEFVKANKRLCHLAIAITCCATKED